MQAGGTDPWQLPSDDVAAPVPVVRLIGAFLCAFLVFNLAATTNYVPPAATSPPMPLLHQHRGPHPTRGLWGFHWINP